MPLPDAEDPKTSNLYAQLRTSQLDSIDSDNFEKVKGPVYVNADNEDEARRIKLWGEISGKLSSSGPIPGTMSSISTQFTSASSTVFNTSTNKDAIWQVVGASAGAFATGTTRVRLFLQDTVTNVSVLVSDVNAGDTEFDMNEPIFVGYPVRLLATPTGYTSGTTDIRICTVRVR